MAATPTYNNICILTIANGASLSSAGAIGNRKLLGIYFPTMTSALTSFQGSYDDVTYFDCYDELGIEVQLPASAVTRFQAVPLTLLGLPFVKVRSGLTAAATTQGAARTIVLQMASF